MSVANANGCWLGKSPADWILSRIRNVAQLSPGYSEQAPAADELCTVVPMELLSDEGSIDMSNQQTIDELQSGLTVFEQGDVLFAKITPCMENGKGAYVVNLPTRYAFGSTEFHVLRPSFRIDGKFLYYSTFNSVFRAYAAENMTGAAGQKRVSSRFLKNSRLFLPSLPEQKQIAAFLDANCQALDAAVAAKRQQASVLDDLCDSILLHAVTCGLHEEVETQETGSVILPRIPIGWRLSRLKSVASVRYGLGQPPAQLDSGVPMIRATDVDAGHIRTDNLLRVDPEELPLDRKPYLKAGEIIVVRSGAYTGDSAIIPTGLDGSVAGYDMVVTATRVSASFLAYCILSRYMLEGQILLLTLRAAQPHLNAEELGSILLALPPTRAEQEAIVDFLDHRLAEVRQMQTSIETQISTLLAYRKSLIHECVTGQWRVTEEDLNRVLNSG